jgi:hypothetical protein
MASNPPSMMSNRRSCASSRPSMASNRRSCASKRRGRFAGAGQAIFQPAQVAGDESGGGRCRGPRPRAPAGRPGWVWMEIAYATAAGHTGSRNDSLVSVGCLAGSVAARQAAWELGA